MSESLSKETIEKIVELGRVGGDPKIVEFGNIPFAVVPDGVKIVSLEPYKYNAHMARPERVKASVTVLDPTSFVEYFSLFRTAHSRVFADESAISVTGLIDYHEAAGEESGAPAWCAHRVTLTLRQSEQWKAWTGHHNKQLTQQQFAEFLEQYATDIVRPSQASIIEVARDLVGTTEVEFGSGVRTQDGQVRFKYSESTKTTVGAGQVAVPERFTIAIPVFVGGEGVEMEALLRFRVKEGKIVFWYTLVRPEEATRIAFLVARSAIAAELGVTVVNGAPSA
jgi:uncharacterized protein YfdQ (DUF2303 family)